MSEFELLDYLITKYDSQNKPKEKKRYILLPFYSGEENLLSFEKSFYDQMGVLNNEHLKIIQLLGKSYKSFYT